MIKALKDPTNQNTSFETLMNRYLFNYRNSIHMSTGVTPSSLVFKNKIKTRLDLLRPIENNVKRQKKGAGRDETFVEGEVAYCRDYRNPNKKSWVRCEIDEIVGDRIYLCKLLNENIVWKRHLNQIIKSLPLNYDMENKVVTSSVGIPSNSFSVGHSVINDSILVPEPVSVPVFVSLSSDNMNRPSDTSIGETEKESNEIDKSRLSSEESEVKIPVRERPKRQIKPPQRLNL